jgi:hypothetical protein
MNSIPRNVLCHGSVTHRPSPIHLRSGQFTCVFEPDTGFLRHLRLGDHEVVRGIYAAVRDQHWNTVPAVFSNLKSESSESSFQLTFDVDCQQGEINFFWRGEIVGEPNGRITFRFHGDARSSFLRNRIGLCVLHPIVECAGKPCAVEKMDGTTEQGTFPRYISPHQPFKNIRAITHEVVPGIRAEVRFEGDIFEMEDQRNWTDASFKTYSTPLVLPIPAPVEKGAHIQQSVTVSLAGAEQKKILPVVQGRSPQFSISTTPVLSKPALGLQCASHGQPLTAREIERLKRLRLSHLRVDLRLADAQYENALRQAAQEAGQLGVGLHIALFVTDNAEAELAAFVSELKAVNPKVSLWMVFHVAEAVTNEKWVQLARQHLSTYGSNILVAAGTDAYFVELNRCRPGPAFPALPCYSVNPQVHAIDNTTLIENLGGQAPTVESAQQFCQQSIVISPITLRRRFNPHAAGSDSTNDLTKLPTQVDVRQMSLFAAGWTLGSIARLSLAGNVHSLTYFETTGWRGVMETEKGSPLPDQFPSRPGMVFPIYHVVAAMADYTKICPTHSSHPLQVEGLTLLDSKDRRRILVANLLSEPQEVKIKTGTCQARVRHLNEQTAEPALLDPESYLAQPGEPLSSVSGKIELKLLPCALACVDIL